MVPEAGIGRPCSGSLIDIERVADISYVIAKASQLVESAKCERMRSRFAWKSNLVFHVKRPMHLHKLALGEDSPGPVITIPRGRKARYFAKDTRGGLDDSSLAEILANRCDPA